MDYFKLIEKYGLLVVCFVYFGYFVTRIISKSSFTIKYPAPKKDDEKHSE